MSKETEKGINSNLFPETIALHEKLKEMSFKKRLAFYLELPEERRPKIFPEIIWDCKFRRPFIGGDLRDNQFKVEREEETYFQVVTDEDDLLIAKRALGEPYPLPNESIEALLEFLPGGIYFEVLRVLLEDDIKCQKNT